MGWQWVAQVNQAASSVAQNGLWSPHHTLHQAHALIRTRRGGGQGSAGRGCAGQAGSAAPLRAQFRGRPLGGARSPPCASRARGRGHGGRAGQCPPPSIHLSAEAPPPAAARPNRRRARRRQGRRVARGGVIGGRAPPLSAQQRRRRRRRQSASVARRREEPRVAPSSGLPGGAARTAPAMAAARPGAPPPPPPLLPLLLLLLLPGGRRALEGEYRAGVPVRRTGARATAHGCTHPPGCPRPVMAQRDSSLRRGCPVVPAERSPPQPRSQRLATLSRFRSQRPVEPSPARQSRGIRGRRLLAGSGASLDTRFTFRGFSPRPRGLEN